MRGLNRSPSVGSFATSVGSFAVPMIIAAALTPSAVSLQCLSGTDRYHQKVDDTLISTHTPRRLRWSTFLPSGVTDVLFYQKDPAEDQLVR